MMLKNNPILEHHLSHWYNLVQNVSKKLAKDFLGVFDHGGSIFAVPTTYDHLVWNYGQFSAQIEKFIKD